MAITRDGGAPRRALAKLALREDEVERLTRELGAILDAVSKVSELDLADVPPTSHPLDVVNVWAADEPYVCSRWTRASPTRRPARTTSSASRPRRRRWRRDRVTSTRCA